MSRRQRSQSRTRLDESSGDELADTAILYNVPHESARFLSSHSLGSVAPTDNTRPTSSKSTKSIPDSTQKPLPPVPSVASGNEQKLYQERRPALAKKTTNMKAINTKATSATKPEISPPILRETTNASIAVPDASRPATSHTTQSAFAPQTSTADAADLSRKISTLMAQATAQEEQTRLRTDAYAATSVKASPLARGKNALVKATRAIKERLSNGSIDEQSKSKRPLANRHSSFQETRSLAPPPTAWQYEILNGMSREKLGRRIAEGENLSNPKIRSMTGDGNIPRKPLPVYESMRSRSMRSESAEDPFSDGKAREPFLPREDYSGFNFDFSKHNNDQNPRDTTDTPVDAHNQSHQSLETSSQHHVKSESKPGFSNMISGLTQHPDVMSFSSPPVDHSTPRVGTKPKYDGDADGQSKLMQTPRASVSNPTYESMSDDAVMGESSPSSHPARLSNGSTLSVKRKEATEDLRAQLAPMAKKAKTDSAGSGDDLGLVTGINDLDAGTERVPLSPKSGNSKGGDPRRNISKGKGISIFDVGKGKAPEIKNEEEKAQKPRTRSHRVKRSSVSRPGSSLFNRRRDSRTSVRQSTPAGEDSMDIDELQMDDESFQIGGRR